MARTLTAIVAELDAKQSEYPVLAGLTSTSATSLFRLLKYLVAFAIMVHETLWDTHRAEVDAKIARALPGTPSWYADRALEFRAGDTLTVDDNGIHYPPGSTGARIITRAAAKEADSAGLLKLFIKVAKDGATKGTLAALSPAELVQVAGYFDRIRFAGTRLEVVSRDADRLQVRGQVYYDPLVDLPALKLAVAAAIRTYLGSLDFNGQVYVARVQDAIQAVPGVRDVLLSSVAARVGAVAPVPFARVYETAAGYITEDAAPSDFATTLTFLPHGA